MKLFRIAIVFFINILLLSYLWIINHYNSDLSVDVVLFHLRFPLVGANVAFIYNYIFGVVLPSILISAFFAREATLAVIFGIIFSVFIFFLQDIIKTTMIVAYQQNNTLFEMLIIALKGAYFDSFIYSQDFGFALIFKITICILIISAVIFGILCLRKLTFRPKILNILLLLIFVLNVYSIDAHFKLAQYFTKNYGNFYEENYAKFAESASICHSEDSEATEESQKENGDSSLHTLCSAQNDKVRFAESTQNPPLRNLIIIFAESFESNFASINSQNLIPNLFALATQNTSFSHTQGFGGHFQRGATSWTVAGIIGYLCGIPLNAPGGISVRDFLPNARCVSDILDARGYKQVMIMGSRDDFAAKGAFLRTHHIESKDLAHFTQDLPPNYTHSWGFSDSYLFKFAKMELENLGAESSLDSAKPFALYLLTNNTHFPDSFIEDSCPKDAESSVESAIKCADNLIFEFIKWVKAQDFYKNTTILIVGDHLTSTHFSIHKGARNIYNAFINPAFSRSPTPNLTQSRAISHFDFAPLILDSLGIETKSFALGRNPLYEKTLLEIYGDNFEAHLSEKSKLYNGFWKK